MIPPMDYPCQREVLNKKPTTFLPTKRRGSKSRTRKLVGAVIDFGTWNLMAIHLFQWLAIKWMIFFTMEKCLAITISIHPLKKTAWLWEFQGCTLKSSLHLNENTTHLGRQISGQCLLKFDKIFLVESGHAHTTKQPSHELKNQCVGPDRNSCSNPGLQSSHFPKGREAFARQIFAFAKHGFVPAAPITANASFNGKASIYWILHSVSIDLLNSVSIDLLNSPWPLASSAPFFLPFFLVLKREVVVFVVATTSICHFSSLPSLNSFICCQSSTNLAHGPLRRALPLSLTFDRATHWDTNSNATRMLSVGRTGQLHVCPFSNAQVHWPASE